MITLGIDTSCDDTSVAILDDEKIKVNLVSSHLIHSSYGGVVPEYASRAHTRLLYPLTRLAIQAVKLSINDIDLIAATAGPGLLGSLLCGLSFAKGLAQACGKPLVAVNHLDGHIHSVFLSNPHLKPPVLILLVSGGHTELILMRDFFDYVEIGATLDDACGEALDKVGKLLGLGYPAGPGLERLAEESSNPVKLPRPNPRGFDFSYSGLKTAARNLISQNPHIPAQDVAAGLQQAAFDHLVDRVSRASLEFDITRVALTGGVAVNHELREKMINEGKKVGFSVYLPSPELCTDNAAMIAAAGKARYGRFGPDPLDSSAFDRVKIPRFSR